MGWDQPRQAFPVARGTLIVLEFRPRSAAIYSALTAFSERRNHILINSARTAFKSRMGCLRGIYALLKNEAALPRSCPTFVEHAGAFAQAGPNRRNCNQAHRSRGTDIARTAHIACALRKMEIRR